MKQLAVAHPPTARAHTRLARASRTRGLPSQQLPTSRGALPALAEGSQELDETPAYPARADAAVGTQPEAEVMLVAVVAGAATLFFGIVPQPLFDLVHGVGSSLGLL
jgi:hypothetical protein